MTRAIHRVILCADGDSRDIDLWSNIPFLLGEELDRRGIELIRLDLSQPVWIKRLWRYTFGPRHKLCHWDTSIDFYRSATNHWLATLRLNQAVRRFGGPGCLLINLSISFAPTITTTPVVLLSDWSYHHYITTRLGRMPDRSEWATISRDSAAMERATLAVLLFPESASRLQRQIPGGHFRFLGHVINDHPLAPPAPAEAPALCSHVPWNLLFIGRPRYREGLELLLQALPFILSHVPVRLDVIGMEPAKYSASSPSGQATCFHGYLSKADPIQRRRYYELLNNADLIINATERWGGFSATVEAMHRYSAVLTPPYAEFEAMFGEDIPFGTYLRNLTPDGLVEAITGMLQNPARLAQQQQAAHQAVQHFSWNAFVNQLFDLIEV
jgi:glycosyltransferase involved in cell wall biosynthesis